MATLVLGVVGAVVGGMFGMPQLGYAIGAYVGSMIDAKETTIEGPRMSDSTIQSNTIGQAILDIYGTVKVLGFIFWAPPDGAFTEHKSAETQGGKGGGDSTTTNNYTYTATFGLSLGKGKITGVRRIWGNKKLVYDNSASNTGPVGELMPYIRIYKGGETQQPDPLMQQYHGEYTSAHRDIAYIVFENIPVEGGQIPQFEVEVIRTPDDVQRSSSSFVELQTTESNVYADTTKGIIRNPVNGLVYIFRSSGKGTIVQLFDPLTYQILKTVVHPYWNYNEISSISSWNFTSTGSIIIADSGVDNSNITFYGIDKDFLGLSTTKINDYTYLGNNDPFKPLKDNNIAHFQKMFPFQGKLRYFSRKLINGNITAYGIGDLTLDVGVGAETTCSSLTVSQTISDFTMKKSLNSFTGEMYYSANGIMNGNYPDYTKSYINIASHVGINEKAFIISEGTDQINVRDLYFDYVTNKLFVLYDNQTSQYTRLLKFNTLTKQIENQIDWVSGNQTVSPHLILDEENRVFINSMYQLNALPKFTYLNIDTFTIKSVEYTPSNLNNNYVNGGCPNNAIYDKDTDSYIYLGTTINDKFSLVINKGNKYDFGTYPLPDVVKELATQTGLKLSQLDTTDLNGISVRGYKRANRTTSRSMIEMLALLYNFDGVESNGKIKFVKRGKAPCKTIEFEEIGAKFYSSDNQFKDVFKTQRIQEAELPKIANLIYLDIDKAYEQNTQDSRRVIDTTENVVSIQAPAVFNADEAKQIVDRLMFGKWASRDKYQFETNYDYIEVEPSDVVRFVKNGTEYIIRITKKDESQGIIKFEGESEDSTVYVQNGVGSSGVKSNQTIQLTSQTQLHLLDIPIFDITDSNLGVYAVVDKINPDASWKGATIYKSSLVNGTYQALDQFNQYSICGNTNTVLKTSDGKNQINYIDYVDVTINNGQLESISKEELDSGGNLCIIGNETLQFMNAELIGVKQYRLSGLIRNRFKADQNSVTHTLNDKFILLNFNNNSIKRINKNDYMVGIEKYYKGVTSGKFVANTSPINFTNNGNGLKPYSVVNVLSSRNENNDLILTWKKQIRGQSILNNLNVIDPDGDSYEVDIYKDGKVIRTLQTTELKITYLNTDQIIDFGSIQSSIAVKIYKLNSVIGRGFDFSHTF